jgi:hypothetical protein
VLALPETIFTPHGEVASLSVQLESSTIWRPEQATLTVGPHTPIVALRDGQSYEFELPPLTEPASLKLAVGDYQQQTYVEPQHRPELIEAVASIALPEYLGRTQSIEQDVRGGVLVAVDGSSAQVEATASRPLESAWIDQTPTPIQQASFATESIAVNSTPSTIELTWRDQHLLTGLKPFQLMIQASTDEAPTVVTQALPRQAVVLDSEQLNFQVLAADDFGIKQVGMSWKSVSDSIAVEPVQGERILISGGNDQTALQLASTFSATALEIAPQPIELQLWVEDYLPGRPRVYGPPHLLFVLTAEEHAIWIMDQLSKWHRAALDVRDKELQLYEENKRLQSMSPDELADDNMRQELRRQASAESANARRLSGLSRIGEQMLRQAARNPEIGVGHLDRWAEMLQILNDIASNRMPSVAGLLDEASEQKKIARVSKPGSGPKAGQNRDPKMGGQPGAETESNHPEVKMPTIADRESTLQPPDDAESPEGPKKKKFNGRKQHLPVTSIAGPAKKSDPNADENNPAEEESALNEALFEQEDLLAEFERIAEELNAVLANLEGSTLVKRLKAASREQEQVAEKIASRISATFGRARQLAPEDREILNTLSVKEEQSSTAISYIMDDMQAYFERRRMSQFKVVLDEMRSSQVIGALVTLGDEIPKAQGLSIAQAEYWADTLDRWGDDLVDPACAGQCPGCKTSDSLPPSVILEALRLLEGETNLREATRVAEQSRPAVEAETHLKECEKLAETQLSFRTRCDKLVGAIEELPNGAARFSQDIELLFAVSRAMGDAHAIVSRHDTDSQAIAAETEAIELLLRCKRINPNGGGGGGTNPGGGGTGTTQDSALALLGSGLNQNERREARQVLQATGASGRVLPEEYRAGLDEYFHQLEKGR